MAADGVGGKGKKPLGMSEFVCADGVVAREWVDMDAEEKLLGMNEFGCAAGCGHRGCKGVAGNGWG